MKVKELEIGMTIERNGYFDLVVLAIGRQHFFCENKEGSELLMSVGALETWNEKKPEPKIVKIERWVNIYKGHASRAYGSLHSAERGQDGCSRIACVKLTGSYETKAE